MSNEKNSLHTQPINIFITIYSKTNESILIIRIHPWTHPYNNPYKFSLVESNMISGIGSTHINQVDKIVILSKK